MLYKMSFLHDTHNFAKKTCAKTRDM